jgi:hypothetical protein
VRVVLAEVDAPGSLHYLLEAEGFQVVGCASDDVELGRVLQQDVDPDVIVLDTDISATSVLVAREHAPDAHVIVLWPEGVQLPTGTERVAPLLVYERLGPAIRQAVNKHKAALVTALAAAEPLHEVAAPSVAEVDAVGAGFGRAASRVSVTSIVLIAAIVLTMGVSFALEGWSARGHQGAPPRSSPAQSIAPAQSSSTSPGVGRHSDGSETNGQPCTAAGKSDLMSLDAPVAVAGACQPLGGGTSHEPAHPGNHNDNPGSSTEVGGSSGSTGGGDQGGTGQGDQGGSGGGSGDQGGSGGGSGDQGGGSGGGGQGDQGGSGQGDQGGGDGDQSGSGQGDQGDEIPSGGDQGSQ